ncbi:hypothetical protein ACFQZZ_00650 [Nocardia sp. GCM10030253]|uniref:hypothetical protein n=1 Tax=Nocardia sp. GCM10030253 TaxID=3273404 RepID=UPI0036450D91
MSKPSKAIGRRIGQVGLFPAVLSALFVGVLVAFAAHDFLRRITPTSDTKAAPIDVTRVTLTGASLPPPSTAHLSRNCRRRRGLGVK